MVPVHAHGFEQAKRVVVGACADHDALVRMFYFASRREGSN
jgi:hypothetical protein